MTISGGEIYGGIETKAGTATITGGTINASGVTPTSHAENNNGPSTAGCAVALVENKSYQLGGAAVSVNISGGTIKGKVAKRLTAREPARKCFPSPAARFPRIPARWPRDYKAVKNADNTFTVGVKTKPDENDVASVGGRFFTTLQAAFDAAQDGETIQLCNDAVAEDGVEMERAKVTLSLDLARHTYTVTNGANVNNRAFKIISGTLNVTGEGKIVVVGSGTTAAEGSGAYGAFRVEAKGVLNVSGVTFGKQSSLWNEREGVRW